MKQWTGAWTVLQDRVVIGWRRCRSERQNGRDRVTVKNRLHELTGEKTGRRFIGNDKLNVGKTSVGKRR